MKDKTPKTKNARIAEYREGGDAQSRFMAAMGAVVKAKKKPVKRRAA